MPTEYDASSKKVKVCRYRGIENPFGHIWQWTDGINVRINPGSNGLSEVFVCSDPSKFNDSNYNGYSHVGNEARAEGYVKEIIFGESGEIIPALVGGGSTTYFCDYHYTNIPASVALRGVLFGGARLAVRVRVSPVRTRLTPPRLRMRTSVLAFALYPRQRNTL